MQIGENLKKLRKKANLTQKELADLSKLSEISIRKYENNERNPKNEQIEKIANVLKVEPIDLLISKNIDLCDYKKIGKNIKQIRQFNKMTQQELADRIGKTESSIRKYESGLIQIPNSVIQKIEKVFNIKFIFSLNITNIDLSEISTSELLKEIERRCIC